MYYWIPYGGCPHSIYTENSIATMVSPLVTPAWLSNQLETSSPQPLLKVLDVTWNPHGKPGIKFFQERHIPTSVFFDLQECRDKASLYRVTLPTAEVFEEYVSGLGVRNDTHIVVYENDPVYKAKAAERVWWMFRFFGHDRVSVLDGGLEQWIKEGYPVVSSKVIPQNPPERGVYTEDLSVLDESLGQQFKEGVHMDSKTSNITPQNPTERAGFRAEVRPYLRRSYEEVLQDFSSERSAKQLLDTRPPHWFDGSRASLWPNLRLGTIKDATRIPFTQLLESDSTKLKTPQDIQAVFTSQGIDLSRPLTVTCNVGVTACIAAMAAYVCGKEDVAVFDGSWDEFSQRAPDDLFNIFEYTPSDGS